MDTWTFFLVLGLILLIFEVCCYVACIARLVVEQLSREDEALRRLRAGTTEVHGRYAYYVSTSIPEEE